MNRGIMLLSYAEGRPEVVAETAIRQRMCECKRRYDRRGARSEINQFAKFRGRHGRPQRLRAYPCPFCGGWHLTKSADRQVGYESSPGAVPTTTAWRSEL